MSVALLLFPDFALILLGQLLHRYARYGDTFWAGLEKMIYFILFPSLLFYSTISAKLNFASTSNMLLTGFIAFVIAIGLGFLAKPLFRPDGTLFASGVQTAFRFNSYIALAIAGRLDASFGTGGTGVALMALLLGVHVPLSNATAVYALARHSNAHILKQMARNPLIGATISGLALNLAGFHLPEFVGLTLSRLGAASIALGLVTVGAGLKLTGATQERGMISWFLLIKLVFTPAVAWLVGLRIGLPPLQLQIVVMFAGLPTASSAFILATRMGGNGPIVAFLISAGTLISIATIPVWLLLVR